MTAYTPVVAAMSFYYLDPGFDPKKLTKAELRSIMASHNVLNLPPATAKKDELLDLFYKEIIAKRDKILAANKAVKPKSDGIVFLDDSSRPSPKKPVTSKPPSPKKVVEPKLSKPASKSPTRGLRKEAPAPPGTPPAVATYKLVTRLENLENNRNSSNNSVNIVSQLKLKDIGTAILLSLLILPYIFLKFWYQWPVYTSSQLNKLETKPLLFLSCPYPSNSAIGSCVDGKLYCSVGYIERRYWFKFGSYCAIDRERLSLIESMKKRIVAELQNHAGMSKCYGKIPAHMEYSELKGVVAKYFKHLSSKNLTDYLDICLKSLSHDGSAISVWTREDSRVFFESKKPVYTYYCSIKIYASQLVMDHPFEIVASIFGLLFASALLVKYESDRRKSVQITHFYIMICKILKEQCSNHRNDPSVPSYIAVNQLRDAVLIKLNGKQKSQLWSKISHEISRNSNIVESITTVRGEQTRVWEWIGADVQLQ